MEQCSGSRIGDCKYLQIRVSSGTRELTYEERDKLTSHMVTPLYLEDPATATAWTFDTQLLPRPFAVCILLRSLGFLFSLLLGDLSQPVCIRLLDRHQVLVVGSLGMPFCVTCDAGLRLAVRALDVCAGVVEIYKLT